MNTILPLGSLIHEWKVISRRNKAEQHPGDFAEAAGTRNVYRDRDATAGRQGTFVRVTNIQESYIVNSKGVQELLGGMRR